MPKRIRVLPGAPWTTIKIVPAKDMAVATDRVTGGFYQHTELTIWISADLPKHQQWLVLCHECLHAITDQYDEIVDGTIKPWGGKR